MSDASLAVQTAIYTKLTTALDPVPVFDHVPQDQAPLYVRIGEDTASPHDTKTNNGTEHVVEINVYSSKRGFSETKQQLARIYESLHRKTLTVAGFQSTYPQYEFSECFAEPDGSRGVIRFSLKTHRA